MKIGLTGTQSGLASGQAKALKSALHRYAEGGEFHHGDCIGADEQAHALALAVGYRVVLHPPIKSKKRAFCLAERLTKLIKPKGNIVWTEYADQNYFDWFRDEGDR